MMDPQFCFLLTELESEEHFRYIYKSVIFMDYDENRLL